MYARFVNPNSGCAEVRDVRHFRIVNGSDCVELVDETIYIAKVYADEIVQSVCRCILGRDDVVPGYRLCNDEPIESEYEDDMNALSHREVLCRYNNTAEASAALDAVCAALAEGKSYFDLTKA